MMETDFLLQGLERMRANAFDFDVNKISEVDLDRWQTLFSMTYEDAENSIKAYRADIDRQRFSDERWFELRTSKEAHGFDREACEYALFCRSRVMNGGTPTTSPYSPPNNTLRGMILGGLLSTPGDVRDIAGFTPKLIKAESEDSSASFCYVTVGQERRIRQGLSDRGITGFESCFISINIAAKDHSALPKLGVDDTTMPQHRLNNITDLAQRYPVLYFFYGTLAQPEIPKRVLESEHEPDLSSLQPAHVLDGKITDLGQYRALVNGTSDSRVNGHAFMIQSENQERALRLYETKMYEVVRCDIWLSGRSMPVKGLTFRLAARR
ncbi:unnamed protein product [Aureobasidium uvarum]|uniref:Gamma-glutamylcyclotransferase AIG2-like domain-containing protein n=1 Tax=Aureobasidium uvarum TaxID=2773716 RepID=A0A9N8PT30_9PEZI|nr:unnamed protein product [Aureobasidium uvarum]